MNIVITATLSPEELAIVAKIKGYADQIATGPGEPYIDNPQSKEDFVRQVYESMIKTDAKNVFLENSRVQRREAERIEEEAISTNVDNAITSTVE